MSQKPLRLEYKNVYFFLTETILKLNTPLEENCFYIYLTLHYTITHYFYQTFLTTDLVMQKHTNYIWARLQNVYLLSSYWLLEAYAI